MRKGAITFQEKIKSFSLKNQDNNVLSKYFTSKKKVCKHTSQHAFSHFFKFLKAYRFDAIIEFDSFTKCIYYYIHI